MFIQLGERVRQFATVTGSAQPRLMLLHLLRHADAGDPAAWTGPDAARPLSDKGRKPDRAARASSWRAIGFKADVVITSPKLRAAQTAELVAERIADVVTEDERLAGSLDLDAVEAILADAGDPDARRPRGSRPGLQRAPVRAVRAAGVTMRKGALARIEVDRPLRPGAGTLRWLLPPDALKPVALVAPSSPSGRSRSPVTLRIPGDGPSTRCDPAN